MTTLTKTEKMLLEEAKKHNGRYSVETCYGRGPYGGRANYGARERNAMFKLEKRGMIEITERTRWNDVNRGYTQGGTVFAFKII